MQLNKFDKVLIFLICIFIFPALLINLGLLPLIEDESIRALVALEMKISHDYITPTLGGIHYFNKPPLFNWIILLLFKLTNNYSEFIIRIPTIFFLIIYALTIYQFTHNQLGKKYAFINALAFLTCGRIILYDSMLGLIDVTYSWTIYLMFNIIYIFNKRKKYSVLFILTYILTAIGFMFKGMPTLVFTGVSLLVIFLVNKNIRKLLSIYHLTGIIIFLLMTGLYYYLYEKNNPGQLKTIFYTLFNESSKRTLVKHNISDNIIHFFIFPFELIYHFLPWTFIVILLLKKGAVKKIKEHPYIKFCALIFISNIIIYWFSPNVYPRYLFMLIPLLFTILFFLFNSYSNENSIWIKIIEWAFLSSIILLSVIQFAIPFEPRTNEIPYNSLIMVISVIIYSLIILLYIKYKDKRLLLTILFIVLFRFEFNMVILKVREKNAPEIQYRSIAIEVGRKLKNDELFLHNKANIFPEDKNKLLNYQTMFYITRERMKVLNRADFNRNDAYFISYDQFLKDKEYIKYFDLPIRHEKIISRVVKLSEDE